MKLAITPRFARTATLWLGWLVPQIMLLGACLTGDRVLTPCQLLKLPGFYLPADNTTEKSVSPLDSNPSLTDLVLCYPSTRHFIAEEWLEGRMPRWQPNSFCGSPLAWISFSPLEFLHVLFPSPVTLAYRQLLETLILASGTWYFASRSLKFSYWVAATISWCSPWIGFMTIWQGYPLTPPVIFFPWLLWSLDQLVREPSGARSLPLVLFSLLTIVSGAPDIAGLVLLTVGLRLIYHVILQFVETRDRLAVGRLLFHASLAWMAAFFISAPFLLPLAEAVTDGSRMQARAAGSEERPPEGPAALTRLMIPEIDGGSRAGFPWIGGTGNLLESSSGAYAGLFLLLAAAPIAFLSSHRSREVLYWLALLILSLGWCINLPGLIAAFQLPGLTMLSFNRWTFASAFSLLILAGIGLEVLAEYPSRVRRIAPVLFAMSIGIAGGCILRIIDPMTPAVASLSGAIREGRFSWLTDQDIPEVIWNVRLIWIVAGTASRAAATFWLLPFTGWTQSRKFRTAVSLFLVLDPWYFALQQTRQSERAIYFPAVPALEFVRKKGEGRILGVDCLPPNLNVIAGLRDIRGYDAIDPARIVRLLKSAEEPSAENPPYAATQHFRPKFSEAPGGKLQVPPVLNLLNTRFLIFRRPPPDIGETIFQDSDYWVVENSAVVPRVFVPARIEVSNDEIALEKLQRDDFNPAQLAFVSEMIEMSSGPCRGSGEVVRETPEELQITAHMETPGVLVISDSWNPGWTATVNGEPRPILCCNTAIRGLQLPAGTHHVVMRYQPVSLPLAWRLMTIGLLVCLAHCLFCSGALLAKS